MGEVLNSLTNSSLEAVPGINGLNFFRPTADQLWPSPLMRPNEGKWLAVK